MNTLQQLNAYSTGTLSYTDELTGIQVLPNRYQINGLIDTARPVLENIEKICSAGASWLSYDIHEGLWGVVINSSGTSIASFNDSNILGNISLSGTGITDLYNSVKVEFPHRDLRDSSDFISIEIPDVDRNANEEDNVLNITYDIINEPVQAQLLGFIELKQSRVNLVIKFETDFGKINLKAGDLIDITNSRFQFVNKMFRITSITEIQDDDGALKMEITALEYDANVYSTADLYRYTRSDENGIITIGDIGVPGVPQITKFELDARPRIVVESTAPTGIVEGLEYWLTNDVNSTEENRSYRLIATKRPAGGGNFASGYNVVLDYDSIPSSNFLIKTRGFNSVTVGPYSDPSGLVEFTAVQVTDAIGPDTVQVDSSGNIIQSLGMLALLNAVNGLFSGNTATNSLFDTIFDLFTTATGVDLIGDATGGGIGGLIGDQIWDTIDSTTEIYQVGSYDLERFTSITFEPQGSSGTTVTLNIDWPTTP